MKSLITIIVLVTALVGWSAMITVNAEEALTVAILKKRNFKPLDDKALKKLIVGRTLVVRNRVTGQFYEATYYANGQRFLRRLTQQQLLQSAAYAYHGGSTPVVIAPYKILDGQVITAFDGKTFKAKVYKVKGKYIAANNKDGGAVNWEVIEFQPARAKQKILTESTLRQHGIKPLDTYTLKKLIVGKTLVVRNRTTGELYEATYSADGKRHIRNITKQRLDYIAYQAFHGGSVPEGIASYKIRNSQLVTTFDGKTFKANVYNVYGKYLAAHSSDDGAVNWEIVEKQ